EPSRAGVVARWQPDRAELDAALREVRARGWALTDEQLASGIRSIAAPVRDGSGRVVAAMNVTVHAAETPVRMLTEEYLPLLLQTASAVSADFARYDALPQAVVEPNVS
ncbi:MAG: IclR family transcriptional regulator domain-containing protein, partial [Nocardioidaceae bacterium]